MAISPAYAHSDAAHLARVKIGEITYYMKDSELRSIVEAFGTATAKDYADAVTSSGIALPTQSAVYDFVLSQVGNLGKVVNLLSESTTAAVTDPAAGDMVVDAQGREWLYDGSAWREVGSESYYVLKTATIAGIDLQDNIASSELSAALDLKAFAHASEGTFTVENYVTGLTGAEYTPVGDITVTLDQTATAADLTKADYTPAGSVNVELSQTSTAATLTKADYTPAGTVSVTPSTSSFYQVASIGKAPSVNESAGSFATAGVTVAVDNTDTEMLVFTTASLASALTATNFDAGELPSLASETTSFVTGISSASFTGSEMKSFNVTGVNYDKATLSSATFTGNKAEDALVTGVSYSKASVVASETTFAGSSTTITPVLTSNSKTVTVSPKASE
jgi:uncharacterized protein YjbI with pentapeptide repeats